MSDDFEMEVVESPSLEDGSSDEGIGQPSPSEDSSSSFLVGALPDEWEAHRLDDICQVNPESFSQDSHEADEFEYISLSDATDGVVTNTESIPVEEAPSRATRKVREGDVLVGTVRPKQSSHGFATEEHDGKVCSSGFGVLRTDGHMNSQYLRQEVLSHRFFRQMMAYVAGSGYPAVKLSDLEKHRIALPPLPEQRKIASVLSAVDQAIQKTEAIIEQAQRVKRGLMQRLLREGIGNHRLTDTGTDLGQLPEHWKSVPLSDAIAPGEYTFTDGARQTLRADEIREQGEARVILLQEVGVGRFNDESPKFATQKKYEEIEHRAIYPGEVVIAKMADPVARACLIPDTYDQYLLGCADVVRLEADDDYDSRFLMYCMNSHDVWKQAAAHLRAAGRNRINLENIAELYIPKPPLEEQKEVANRLTTVDAQLDRDRGVADRLERLKKGLMQDLLTGEVRTDDKAIEVLDEVTVHG